MKLHALLWFSAAGAELGTPWWVLRVDNDEPPYRCAAVTWSGGESHVRYKREGFSELPDGPRGVVELKCDELQMVRAPTDADARETPHE